MLVTERLDATARAFPDALAIVHGDTRLTWAQVREASVRTARGLLAHGVGRGDHVALWLPNHPEWLLLWLGAVRIGAAVVPVNTRYKPTEAAYVVGKSDAKLLFLEEDFLGVDYVAGYREMSPMAELRDVVVVGRRTDGLTGYEEFLAGGDAVTPEAWEAATAGLPHAGTVIIVFTSGTTGLPKGVVHTHDVVRMVDTVADWLELGPEDRVLGHLPLFHVAGVFSSFMLAMARGGAFVQLDAWDAGTALDLVEREGITVLSGIPTHFVDLLAHPDVERRDTASLRTGWIGGSFIAPEVIRGARETLGMEAILPVYGMTETTSCTTLARKTDPVASLLQGKGVPLGGYDVRVVDPESRAPVETGTEGEVSVRGYTVMKGYYREPEATAAVMDDDGWFYTGDLGVFDENGYLSITGRLSDKFIVGGNNVHPADIERVLLEHPAIEGAQVVPAPDNRLGEVAIAFVERSADAGKLTEDDVRGHCRANLASFKVPRRVVFVSSWPMTPTGKVQKVTLQKQAAELD